VGDHVEPGGDAARPRVGEVAPERRDQGVAPAAVDEPGPAQVTVELAAPEEVGQGELLDNGRTEVVLRLRPRQFAGQPLGDHEPAQPQRRRKRLAHAPGVHHELRGEPLRRARRGESRTSALVCSAALGVAEITPERLAAVAVVAAGITLGMRAGVPRPAPAPAGA
jgi:hypothetical protein